VSVISPSKLGEQFDADFQAKVNACENAEQLRALMHDRELSSGLVRLDWSPEYRIPVETPQPQSFTKTITVNGVSHTLQADSSETLAAAEVSFYRSAFSQPAATATQPTPARDPQTGRFTADEQAAVPTVSPDQKAALALQFQLGQIDSATYLERSGAIADYLEQAGVPLPALQEAVQEKQAQKDAESWSDATNVFIANHPEWPGTDLNRQTLGKYIIENGLLDGDPLEALEAAYNHARENGMLVANPETAARARQAEQAQKISECSDPAELRQLLGYRGENGSGYWGGR